MSKTAISTYLSTITLNEDGLNVPIKIDRVAEWIKNRTINMVLTRDTSDQKTHTV